MADTLSESTDAKSGAPQAPIANFPGIGPKRAEALASRGIVTAEDVLFHLPSRYQDWRERRTIAQLEPGTMAVVEGRLDKVKERPMRGSRWRRIVTATLTDREGKGLGLVWFNLPSYMRGRMPSGQQVAVFGRVTEDADGTLQIMHPELRTEGGGDGEPIRSVYRIPDTIPQRLYASIVDRALAQAGRSIQDSIPGPLRKTAGLRSLFQALEYVHHPPADADLRALQSGRSPGHTALAFDELFAFELAMCLERERAARRAGYQCSAGPAYTDEFVRALPFTLTNAQNRAIAEIGADLESARQMNRILIGDVGSGKTAVAFWAILRAVESGAQAAMMAPTEILAEQHHRSFQKLCGAFPAHAALLTGRVSGEARNSTLRALARGDIPVVFGTQALIQESVHFKSLALAIVDEQHRFGVFDRARLKALGPAANVLMMTATPIPRSLAMTLFANLDVSVLDELPPGRTPIATKIVAQKDLPRIDTIVKSEVERGRRAYYIVPLIEDDEEDLKSVTAMAARLSSGALGEARVGILHGRMRSADKDAAMRDFRDGRIDVLVSTTVVEVGIDVPEATVIVVIAAERYGLAQLHQLRGRVGRGSDPSRCILVVSPEADEAAHSRIEVMVRCTSGADVAQADLEMRGPGDLLGARQTGALPLRFIRFISDPAMIRRAREMAEAWLQRDGDLKSPESRGAKAALRRMLDLGFSMADVG